MAMDFGHYEWSIAGSMQPANIQSKSEARTRPCYWPETHHHVYDVYALQHTYILVLCANDWPCLLRHNTSIQYFSTMYSVYEALCLKPEQAYGDLRALTLYGSY